MKKFHFRLESLVRLREAARDERRSQLAEALRVQAALEEQWETLQDTLKQVRSAQRAGPGPVDVDQLLDAQRYEMVLLVEQRKLEPQRSQILAEVEKRRQALVWADQDVRVLEKLRDAQFQRWQVEEGRVATRELDEFAGQRRALEASS